jgi:transposase
MKGIPMCAHFQISLDIPDVKILKIEKNKEEDLIITLKSTKDSASCHKCGNQINKLHSYGETIILRHLPILGQRVYIRIRPARYVCEYCEDRPTTTEQASWYNRRSKFTKAYEDYLMRMLINSTLTDVSRKEEVSYEEVDGVLNRKMESQIDWNQFKELPLIGFDEIALKKGHKDFVVIVSTKIRGSIKVLAILADRKKETIKSYINTIPEELRSTIQIACCDMYDGYINGVKEILGNKVKVIIDRFHVAKNYRKGIETTRKKELKRLKKELTESEYKKLKGAMWALRKKEKNLTKQEKEVLTILFSYSESLKLAYHFQNSLTEIFNKNIGKQQASKLIRDWIKKVNASGLSCFEKFISTLGKNWDSILNYFHRKGRKNSGFIEGLNNKVKVIKRRCYGIFKIEKLFQRISLDLEGYERFA